MLLGQLVNVNSYFCFFCFSLSLRGDILPLFVTVSNINSKNAAAVIAIMLPLSIQPLAHHSAALSSTLTLGKQGE
jgi:hypothetical protein